MSLRMIARTMLLLVLIGSSVLYLLTLPSALPLSGFGPRTADLANGETMFNIGGCASCHATPGQPDLLLLGGGHALRTMFGTFKVPNISADPKAGIGAWTEAQFASAMLRGVGRNGEHLFPSFPFTSYQRMALADVRDLYAFMRTVPATARPSEPHELGFPFNMRVLLGGWKLLFLDGRPFAPDPTKDAAFNRGAYLVEGPGHCAECHSGRNILGGIKGSERFAGGAGPDGKGWVPNITPHEDGLAKWSAEDIAYFLQSGFTPDGLTVEGEMAAVVKNTAKLSPADRLAMAAYLRSLPARAGKRPQKKT